MDFPFETTTKDGQKATVIGTMPNGRLFGCVLREDGAFFSCDWPTDGRSGALSITIPLQIKPLTTYRMRNGGIAWTSGLVRDGWIRGMNTGGDAWSWRVTDGRWDAAHETGMDLIEELSPGTTE